MTIDLTMAPRGGEEEFQKARAEKGISGSNFCLLLLLRLIQSALNPQNP